MAHWTHMLLLIACAAACNTPQPAPATAATTSFADLPTRGTDATGFGEPADLSLALTAVDPATGVAANVTGAVRDKGPWSGRLAIVLPELGQPSEHYRELLREIARGGHHALAIPSPLQESLAQTCGTDAACYSDARAELLDGTDRTPKVTLKYSDCLQNRIVMVILHLAKGGQGWGQYVVSGKPNWPAIQLVGHGEGAGQAAFVGTQLTLARVALLAGPQDGSGDKPAGWLSSTHKTANKQWFAFGHTADPLWPRVAASWTALGLGAGTQSWPSVDPGAVFGVQGMTTALAVSAPRLAVATDADTPRDAAGKPKYRATWRALVGAAPQ